MIVIGIGIGIVVGVVLMGIMCQGKVEDLEREVARYRDFYLSGKVK